VGPPTSAQLQPAGQALTSTESTVAVSRALALLEATASPPSVAPVMAMLTVELGTAVQESPSEEV